MIKEVVSVEVSLPFRVFSTNVVQLIQDWAEEHSAKFKRQLATFSKTEVVSLLSQIEAMMYGKPKSVVDLVEVGAKAIIDTARAVKASAGNPDFAGFEGRGNELTCVDIDPLMFNNVWGAARSDWEYYVSSAGVADYIGTDASPESTAEEEGYVILGFEDPVPEPIVIRAQLIRDGDKLQYVSLRFTGDYPVAALPEPWVILPEQTFQIKVRTSSAGKTKLKPIGFKIMRAKVAIESL